MTSSNGKHEFLSPPESPEDLGSLGSYRVVSELGKGGMGFVFRAEDKRLKRTVALKVMNKKVAATPHSRARFISEARAMAAVHHDNVATIFEVGEHSGTPFMAMEMLKGETLEEYKLKKERPNYEQIIRFAIETAKGLAAAHAQGIVHRDIKPANIWVEQDSERIKILDFGLALAQTPVDQLAGRGSVVGTPGYLSPEQARTEPLDDRSDLYSLGVVLYELAAGKLPLQSSTVAGQLIAILVHKPQPIREINEKIPQPLADLIHQLLRKEPRNRVRSAADLVEELKRVQVECESKSEVALAINKLQMGLQEVVSKKDSGLSVLEAGVAPVTGADPFSSLPDAAFDSLPDASSASLSGSHLAAAPATAIPGRPKPTTGKTAKKPQQSSPIQKYWPIGAGVAVAAIVILIIAIAALNSGSEPVTQPTSTANLTPEKAADQQPPKPDKPAPKTNQSQADKSPNKNQQRNNKPKKNQQKKPNNQQRKDSSPAKAQDQNVAEDPKPAPKSQPKPEMLTVSQETKVKPIPPRPDPIPEPAPPSQIITISSMDGRGADSTVKRGGGKKNPLGLKPSLAIQMRGDMEIQHAYVRFDLATVSPDGKQGGQGKGNKKDLKERKTGNAELILYSVDGSAKGANIRVYGADNPNSERWREAGPLALSWTLSFSEAGLDSLPLLAEVPSANLEDNAVKISSPELADFIRTTQLQTATFIIASGKNSQKPIQFVSRDGDADKAPVLSIEVLGP